MFILYSVKIFVWKLTALRNCFHKVSCEFITAKSSLPKNYCNIFSCGKPVTENYRGYCLNIFLCSHQFWSIYLNICMNCIIYTALHVMQTRYSEENSVRPSVCPSVCLSVTRVIPGKMEERPVQIFIPYERIFISLF